MSGLDLLGEPGGVQPGVLTEHHGRRKRARESVSHANSGLKAHLGNQAALIKKGLELLLSVWWKVVLKLH